MSHRPQHHLKEHEGGGKHGAREQREPAGTPGVRRPRGRREARPRRQQTPQERRPATWKARPRSSAGRMGRGGGARRRGGAAAAWGGEWGARPHACPHALSGKCALDERSPPWRRRNLVKGSGPTAASCAVASARKETPVPGSPSTPQGARRYPAA